MWLKSSLERTWFYKYFSVEAEDYDVDSYLACDFPILSLMYYRIQSCKISIFAKDGDFISNKLNWDLIYLSGPGYFITGSVFLIVYW